MKLSWLTVYIIIAFIAAFLAFRILAKTPPPGWPINLIHLLTRD